MSATLARWKRLRGESGFTLVEMLVAMAILGLVLSIFFGILASVQMSFSRETSRTDTMDQGRLAIEAIDRQVRSASVLLADTCSAPVTAGSATYPVASGYGLTIYTRNAFAAYPDSSFRWVQYAVAGPSPANQTLWTREHLTTPGAAWTTWRSVATGLVNEDASSAPFALSTSPDFQSPTGQPRVVDVTLVVNTKPADTTSSRVKLASSMSIRNQSGSVTKTCSDVPQV